jgi:hypothetical protein
MVQVKTTNTDAAILARVVQPERGDMNPDAARAILAWDFPSADRDRMHQLAVKNQDGLLTEAEQQELDSYRRVGRFLDLLSSKARQSLRGQGQSE